jgi:hypothetical protein
MEGVGHGLKQGQRSRSPVKQRGKDMEEPLSSIIDRRTAIIAFLREALAEGAVSCGELELKARQLGLLAENQSITHAKLFKEAKKVLGIRSVRTGFGQSGEWWWELSGLPQAPTTVSAVQLSKAGVGTADTYAAASSGIRHAQTSQGRATPESRIPWEWTKGVARLDYHRAPIDVPLHRWRQFIDDCNHFLNNNEGWAQRAAELGWDAISLFGCNSAGPLSYLGDAGLSWFVAGGKLVRLDRQYAVIAINGAEQVFHRRPNSNRVTLPWWLRSGPRMPPA